MTTVAEIKARLIDQLRRVRLEEKRMRAGALGYDAGELDLGDLAQAAISYAAAVRVYRDLEAVLMDLGIAIPKVVRDGDGINTDWQAESSGAAAMCSRRSDPLH